MLIIVNKSDEEIAVDILIVLTVAVIVCGFMIFLKNDEALSIRPEDIPEDSMLRRHFYTELEAKRQAVKR